MNTLYEFRQSGISIDAMVDNHYQTANCSAVAESRAVRELPHLTTRSCLTRLDWTKYGCS